MAATHGILNFAETCSLHSYPHFNQVHRPSENVACPAKVARVARPAKVARVAHTAKVERKPKAARRSHIISRQVDIVSCVVVTANSERNAENVSELSPEPVRLQHNEYPEGYTTEVVQVTTSYCDISKRDVEWLSECAFTGLNHVYR